LGTVVAFICGLIVASTMIALWTEVDKLVVQEEICYIGISNINKNSTETNYVEF
jgi:hypothetical protein